MAGDHIPAQPVDSDQPGLPPEVATSSHPKIPLAVTHPHVDLDAAACIALLGIPVDDVGFLPASAKSLPEAWQGARVVDHPLGHKGELSPDGTQHSAASSLPEAQDLVGSDFLQEIEEHDSLGFAPPRFSLAKILAGVRAYYRNQGLQDEVLDRAILSTMLVVLRGLILLERDSKNRQLRPMDPMVEVGHFRFALRVGESSSEWRSYDKEITGFIYHHGFNLGIVRFTGRENPDLRLLAADLPGWFIHPSGFLACWGSFKAPATEPPPAGTPQNAEELVELLRRRFQAKQTDAANPSNPPTQSCF